MYIPTYVGNGSESEDTNFKFALVKTEYFRKLNFTAEKNIYIVIWITIFYRVMPYNKI